MKASPRRTGVLRSYAAQDDATGVAHADAKRAAHADAKRAAHDNATGAAHDNAKRAAHDDATGAVRSWLRLLGCSTLVENEVRRRLHTQFHTTLPRFDVLAQLDLARRERVPGLTMSELSRRLMVTNGNLTTLVERLAHEKLIRRATSASDKRMSIISLTPAGKRTLDAMTPAHRKWIVGMFGGLSSEEQEQLYALLGKLRTSIRDSLSQPEDA